MTQPDSPSSERAPRQRHDGWTAHRQRQFCEALSLCGSVEQAAAAVGMSRETAYRLRRRTAGQAFAYAWDAALLLARQRMIDDVMDMAFEGSVERHYRDGKLVLEKRRRDPRALLATIERLSSNKSLGTPPTQAVAGEFERFLDCLEADATGGSDETVQFMDLRADQAGLLTREQLVEASYLLAEARAARTARRMRERGAASGTQRSHANSDSA